MNEETPIILQEAQQRLLQRREQLSVVSVLADQPPASPLQGNDIAPRDTVIGLLTLLARQPRTSLRRWAEVTFEQIMQLPATSISVDRPALRRWLTYAAQVESLTFQPGACLVQWQEEAFTVTPLPGSVLKRHLHLRRSTWGAKSGEIRYSFDELGESGAPLALRSGLWSPHIVYYRRP